jgi:hypothetical protein
VVSAKAVASRFDKAEIVPTLGMMMANGKPIQFFQDLDMMTVPGGHSYIGGHMGADYSPDTADAYVRSLIDYHGEARAKEVLSVDRHLMMLYPSSFWHARYQTVRSSAGGARPDRDDRLRVPAGGGAGGDVRQRRGILHGGEQRGFPGDFGRSGDLRTAEAGE